MSRMTATSAPATSGRRSWVRAWPLRPVALGVLAWRGLVLLAVITGAGLLFMWLLDDGPVGDADRSGARWLEDHRTPTWNGLSHYGSMLSDTMVKVALVAGVGALMVVIWRRWHDAVFLATAVILEATVFVIASFIVGRDRPPVEQLDPPAPSGSFPSGHAGAAVAFYVGVFIIVCWHTRNRVVRFVFGVIAVAAPLAVGLSRMQRGMHHPLDVAAGFAVGLAALVVTAAALRRGVAQLDESADDPTHDPLPDRLRRLDLTTEGSS